MQDKEIDDLINQAISKSGRKTVIDVLRRLVDSEIENRTTLTVIGNSGVHKIPDRYLRGEIYEVSSGSWVANSEEELSQEFSTLLQGLARKLRENHWQKIYFIPTGHPALSIQIKTMIYRLTRQNTIDLYHRDGKYFELNIDHRAIALLVSGKNDTDGELGAE